MGTLRNLIYVLTPSSLAVIQTINEMNESGTDMERQTDREAESPSSFKQRKAREKVHTEHKEPSIKRTDAARKKKKGLLMP